MPICKHITEELCIPRVPKTMFQKKASILANCDYAGGNKNHSREAKVKNHSAFFCIECELSNSSFVCLICGKIYCGRYDAGHAIDHYIEKNHAVVMDCISFGIHCYECDEEVTLDFEPTLKEVKKSLQLLFELEGPEKDEEDEIETVAEKAATIEIKTSPKQTTNKKQKTRKGKFLGIKSGKVVPMTPQLAQIIATGKPRGLKNIGNTCFMNSVLQAFSSVEPFFSYMNSMPPIEDYLIESPKEKTLYLSDEMRNFCNALATLSPKNVPFTPNALRNIFISRYDRFRGFQQHDAHEFMRLFLDQIHTEMKKCRDLPDLPEDSTIISEVFGGILQSKVQCMRCQKESNKDDVMLDISLDLITRANRSKLADCLDKFFAREVLDRGEKYDCSKCKSKQNSSKQMFIKKLPQILCLHLKRFGDDGEKMDNLVDFPLDGLSLDNYMAEEVVEPPTFYELSAIVVHIGVVAEYGHYVAYCKRNSQWFSFNDDLVKLVEKPTILKQRAYILVYSRKSNSAPTPTPSTSHSLNLSEHAAKPQHQSPVD